MLDSKCLGEKWSREHLWKIVRFWIDFGEPTGFASGNERDRGAEGGYVRSDMSNAKNRVAQHWVGEICNMPGSGRMGSMGSF